MPVACEGSRLLTRSLLQMPYKLILTFINVASCYWSLFKYAKYFAKRHPKIIEDAKAVEVAMRVNDEQPIEEEKKPLTTVHSEPVSRSESSMSSYTKTSTIGDLEHGYNRDSKRLSFISGSEECFTPTPRHTVYSPEPGFPAQPTSVYAHSGYWEGPDADLGHHAQAYASQEDAPPTQAPENRRRKNSWSQSPV